MQLERTIPAVFSRVVLEELPVSWGIIEGRARVILKMEDACIDIQVTAKEEQPPNNLMKLRRYEVDRPNSEPE
ncbi:hypothetical protein [Desulfosporosinus sp. Sb-LF]|uniref:hypothetical protein n=1 Tax=Desulfosporosinus sp. Sb-LF TaxID=2560027 RepID=UPI0018EE6534|nr:hypothetical protein [Desulfosporosinus sp. Sb-LF]